MSCMGFETPKSPTMILQRVRFFLASVLMWTSRRAINTVAFLRLLVHSKTRTSLMNPWLSGL